MTEDINDAKLFIDFIVKKEYDIKQKYLNKVYAYVEKYHPFFQINSRDLTTQKRNIFIGKLAELCLRNLIRENGLECNMVKKDPKKYDDGYDLICICNELQEKIESKSTENKNSKTTYIRNPNRINFDWLIHGLIDINQMKYSTIFICDKNTVQMNLIHDPFLQLYYVEHSRIA